MVSTQGSQTRNGSNLSNCAVAGSQFKYTNIDANAQSRELKLTLEQLVGQELIAYENAYEQPRIHYWHREERTSTAEVDYVIQVGSQIVPLEVKAGKTGRLKFIQVFLEEKKLPLGVRISQKGLELEKNILSAHPSA